MNWVSLKKQHQYWVIHLPFIINKKNTNVLGTHAIPLTPLSLVDLFWCKQCNRHTRTHRHCTQAKEWVVVAHPDKALLPILTGHNGLQSAATLPHCVTLISLQQLCLLCVIITQTRCTMVLLLPVISEESYHHHCRCPSTSGSWPREKNLEPAQNAKIRSNLMQRIHARVRVSIE